LSAQNHLIEILARRDRRRLLAICEPVDLVLGQVLGEPATPTRHSYFPVNSFISLVAAVAGSPGIEVGMVGREGMLGAHLALGVGGAPLRAVVQGPGSAWRVGTGPLSARARAQRHAAAHTPPVSRGSDDSTDEFGGLPALPL